MGALSELLNSETSSSLILVLAGLISFFFLLFNIRRDHHKNLPQGSLGLPIIGETLSYLGALRDNRGVAWVNERVAKHGSVFKTSLMGCPTVVITGQAGNKFVLSTDEVALTMKQTSSSSWILGKHNIFELSGNRHKLLKGAMMAFLKPESLQEYVGIMDDLVKTILHRKIKEKDTIELVPFLKELTFHVSNTLLFGFHEEPTQEAFLKDLSLALKGIWTIPVNFPGTILWRSLRARSRIDRRVLPIIRKRKDLIKQGVLSARRDVISCLIVAKDEKNEPIAEEEILDNMLALILASHDTTACLLSLIAWKLGKDPEFQQNILQEHMEILRERQGVQDKLTWSELQKMKYTWRVVQEMLRLIPILFAHTRKTLKDINFGGYDIPKGWQVLCVPSATHMDANVFDDPEKFEPSRFLNPPKPIPPFTYIPFGGGPHMCPGNEFSRVEVLTIIHHMVTSFEWSLVNPNEGITYQPFPYPSMGLHINIKARNPSN